MAFKGSLEDLSLIDVLQLLYVARKTGLLHVESPEGKASLALRDGFIVGATHPSRERNVGKILLEMGLASDADITRELAEQRQAEDERQPLIRTLVALGCLDAYACWKALERRRGAPKCPNWSDQRDHDRAAGG